MYSCSRACDPLFIPGSKSPFEHMIQLLADHEQVDNFGIEFIAEQVRAVSWMSSLFGALLGHP